MTDFYWPSLLEPAATRLEIHDSAGRFVSPLTGYTRTVARPGERMRLSLSFENTNAAMRAALQSTIARMRGATHRIWAYDHSNRLRGSFPATELLTNNTFANGTTGWSFGGGCAATVNDRVLRMTATATTSLREMSQSVSTMVQYAPYALRSLHVDGRGSAGLNLGRALTLDTGIQVNDYGTERGLRTVSGVFLSATAKTQYPLVWTSTSGFVAGDFVEMPWCSLARCALVDNGGNLLLQSDNFTTSWTNTRSTDAANSITAPDGTVSADSIIEDSTASNTHDIWQTVTVASTTNLDYAAGICLKAGTRSFARLAIREETGGFDCYVDINLNTGAIGTPTAGTNWSNPRAFVVNLGNGWWWLSLVGLKTNAATGMTLRLYMANSLGGTTYTGDGSSLLYAWRANLKQSSVPTRLTATTTAAVAAASQALAGPLHTKGWPVSTNGLLLPGDQVQIGNRIVIVTSPVNSDAAGLATIEGYPVRISAPADNAPVIINQPMGKFFLESDVNGWGNKPGIFSDAEIVLSEAA